MKKYIILFLLCVCTSHAYAQFALPDYILAPNAANLGRYGDIPMSYHTGRADISIPLHHTEQRGVSLDITLSYDTSGILANSLPGWVGHGWTLDVGGVIARSINGAIDDYEPSPVWGGFSKENYFHSYTKLTADILEGNGYPTLKAQVRNDSCDLAPDIFYFKFMGKSGRFFLGGDGNWHVLCDSNLDVIFNVHDDSNYISPFISKFPGSSHLQPKTIKGFTILDDEGNKYIFGSIDDNDTNAIEYSIPFFMTGDQHNIASWVANAWYLSQVQDRFGNILYSFTYERGKFIVQVSRLYESTYYSGGTSFQFILHNTSAETAYDTGDASFPYYFSLNSPVYLKQIQTLDKECVTFSQDAMTLSSHDFYGSLYQPSISALYSLLVSKGNNINQGLHQYQTLPFYYLQSNNSEVVAFQNDSNTNKTQDPLASMAINPLKHISIRRAGGIPYKNYDLSYLPKDSARLFLKEIKVRGSALHSATSYQFTYHQPACLPREYLSLATDHWGYYKGGNGQGYSNLPWNYNNFFSSKNPSFNSTKCGMLTEIQYPTGGVTKLIYEQHEYSGYMSEDRQTLVSGTGNAGGLRIASILNYEDSTKEKLLSSRQFLYVGGQLFAQPQYYWSNWHPLPDNSGTTISISLFKDVSVIPLFNSFGSHIGYSKVTETISDGTRNVYTYSNIADSKDGRAFIDMGQDVSPEDMYSERGYKRGRLLSKETYWGPQNVDLYSSTTYHYRTDNFEDWYVPISNIGYRSNGSLSYWIGGVYKLFYPKYDVISKVEKVRYGDRWVCDSTVSSKSDHHNQTVSVGFTHKAEYRRCNSETTYRGSDSTKIVYEYPLSVSALAKQYCFPVKSVSYYHNGQFIKKNKTIFGKKGGSLDVPLYELQYTTGSSIADTLIRYVSYTPTYRVSEYVDKENCSTLLFWNEKDQLTARVRNPMGTITCNTQTSSPMNVVTSTNSNAIFGIFPSDVLVCTFNDEGQIASITQKNGVTLYYTYDTWNRLSSIQDENGKVLKKYTYKSRIEAQ
ncbi:MAG: RHS repeat protein [Bacteroidaceae bacterium]|nr:RHS repeat protein [Bacteroidaceae bacterium]